MPGDLPCSDVVGDVVPWRGVEARNFVTVRSIDAESLKQWTTLHIGVETHHRGTMHGTEVYPVLRSREFTEGREGGVAILDLPGARHGGFKELLAFLDVPALDLSGVFSPAFASTPPLLMLTFPRVVRLTRSSCWCLTSHTVGSPTRA